MRLAKELKRIRLEKKMSVQDASNLIGITKQYLNYIESGKRKNISFIIMARIAECYGVSLDYLAKFTKEK